MNLGHIDGNGLQRSASNLGYRKIYVKRFFLVPILNELGDRQDGQINNPYYYYHSALFFTELFHILEIKKFRGQGATFDKTTNRRNHRRQ